MTKKKQKQLILNSPHIPYFYCFCSKDFSVCCRKGTLFSYFLFSYQTHIFDKHSLSSAREMFDTLFWSHTAYRRTYCTVNIDHTIVCIEHDFCLCVVEFGHYSSAFFHVLDWKQQHCWITSIHLSFAVLYKNWCALFFQTASSFFVCLYRDFWVCCFYYQVLYLHGVRCITSCALQKFENFFVVFNHLMFTLNCTPKTCVTQTLNCGIQIRGERGWSYCYKQFMSFNLKDSAVLCFHWNSFHSFSTAKTVIVRRLVQTNRIRF